MRSRFRFWTVCCPLVGLLVVLAIMGHDLAMAGDAHQTVGSGHHGSHHGDQPTTVGHRMIVEPTHGERRMDTASNIVLDGCGYDRVAVLTVDESGTVDLHGSVGSADVEHPAPMQRFPAVDEPTAPPSVRRAILQVFLI